MNFGFSADRSCSQGAKGFQVLIRVHIPITNDRSAHFFVAIKSGDVTRRIRRIRDIHCIEIVATKLPPAAR
ncbi:hypothetical protein [Verminephrobacter eiseniae]|uniref:hypothetical protein n=1 Tax=Verminephrobacter eiseniae TaxID=364317 RepID=UPI002238D69A|nr:hypothetical protein [Verminephrobacter eiseniae]